MGLITCVKIMDVSAGVRDPGNLAFVYIMLWLEFHQIVYDAGTPQNRC